MSEDISPNKETTERGSFKQAKKSKNSFIAGIAVVVLVVIALAVAYFSGNLAIPNLVGEDNNSQTSEESSQPDDNRVVAIVGNDEIKQLAVNKRLELMISSSQIPVDQITPEQRSQAEQIAVQQLINEALILQAAAQENIVIDPVKVQAELDSIVASFPDQNTFEQTLASNGVTLDDLKIDLGRRLLIDAYIEQYTDGDSIEVSDQEISDLYEQYASQQENMPAIEGIRDQLEQQVFQEKLNKQIDAIIQTLQAATNVQIF